MEMNLSSICLFEECLKSNFSRILGCESKSDLNKLKHRLRTLMQHVSNYSLIELKWLSFDYFEGLVLVFSHGVISSLSFDSNYRLLSVYHEDFLQSKQSQSKRISSIEFDENSILISYVEPYLSVVKNLRQNFGTKRKRLKYKLQSQVCSIKTITLEKFINNKHRQAKRRLIKCGNNALVWWNSMSYRHNWATPMDNSLLKINLLLIGGIEARSVRGSNTSLHVISANAIEGEIFQADFIDNDPHRFSVLYRRNNSAYNLSYAIHEFVGFDDQSININKTEKAPKNSLALDATLGTTVTFEVTIPLEKLCYHAEFTKLKDKILLLCDDESVMLFNIEQNILYSLHSSIPICFLSTNPLDSIFAASDPYGHVSLYDNAFNTISSKVQSKFLNCNLGFPVDSKTCCTNKSRSVMSIKRFQFVSPQILVTLMVENKHHQDRNDQVIASSSSQTSSLSALKKKNSINVCCLKLLILPYEVTFKRLIQEYLHRSLYEEALNMLRMINWNCSKEDAYWCLHQTFQHLLRMPLQSTESEKYIESTLAAFLIPMTPIDYKIFEAMLPYIRHLAIQFCYHLIRNQSFQKAYQLAIELKSTRLWLLLIEMTRQHGHHEISELAYEQAKNLKQASLETNT